jgi:ABC-type glycerol-3-phosphate transport system substrate-binding protein
MVQLSKEDIMQRKAGMNYLSRRGFLKSVGVTSAALALAACTQIQPATTQESAAPAGETATLELWGWWDLRMAFYEQIAKAFMEQNSDVEITVVTLPFEELQQKIFSSLAANTGPNLLKMSDSTYFRMRDENILLPFPEDIFPESWFREMYPSFDLDSFGPYVVPTAGSGTVLIYNKAMFEEAGLDPDTPPATWDEFIEAAKAVTQRDSSGMTRAGFVPSAEFAGLSQVYQLGGNILDNSGDAQVATIDSDEVQRAFQYLADLALVHEVWDPTFPSNEEAVGTGLAAMTEEQSWIIGEFAGTYADIFPDLGFAPNPTPTSDAPPFLGYKSTVLSVSALTGHTDEAGASFRYLEYLYKDAGKDAFWGLAELLSSAPVRADLADDPRLEANPALKVVSEVLPLEKDPVYLNEDLGAAWNDALTRITIEHAPVAEALATLNTRWQELLDQGLAKYMV